MRTIHTADDLARAMLCAYDVAYAANQDSSLFLRMCDALISASRLSELEIDDAKEQVRDRYSRGNLLADWL